MERPADLARAVAGKERIVDMHVTHRRRMAAVGLVLMAMGAVGFVISAPPASADVDTAQGSAFGASVGGAVAVLPPTPTVAIDATEATPPEGLGPVEQMAFDASVPNFEAAVLRAATEAGDLAGDDHTGFAASLAEASNVSVTSLGGLVSGLNADFVRTSCTSNGEGSGGNTFVAALNLGTEDTLTGPLPPNTPIQIPGVLTGILNEQVRTDEPGSTSIVVRGAHLQLLPSPVATTTLDIVIAESRCAAQGPDVLTSASTTSSSINGSTSTSVTSTTTSSSITSTTTSIASTSTSGSAAQGAAQGPAQMPPTTAPTTRGGLARTGSPTVELLALGILVAVMGALVIYSPDVRATNGERWWEVFRRLR